jgi:hypothetical protein
MGTHQTNCYSCPSVDDPPPPVYASVPRAAVEGQGAQSLGHLFVRSMTSEHVLQGELHDAGSRAVRTSPMFGSVMVVTGFCRMTALGEHERRTASIAVYPACARRLAITHRSSPQSASVPIPASMRSSRQLLAGVSCTPIAVLFGDSQSSKVPRVGRPLRHRDCALCRQRQREDAARN